jgi:NAD(P)-dependent dehydrogenase (short-subunit alcohol dehydrogenase family)
VMIASRSAARVETAAKKLADATGGKCAWAAMDVRDPAQVKATVDKVLAVFGRLDILVNGAAGNFLCVGSACVRACVVICESASAFARRLALRTNRVCARCLRTYR